MNMKDKSFMFLFLRTAILFMFSLPLYENNTFKKKMQEQFLFYFTECFC